MGVTKILVDCRRYGTIACDVFSPGPTVFLKIGQTVFASKALTPNLPCFCANCVQSETVLSNMDESCGLPGFLHGSINPFQIIVEENSLCLNRIELYFNYTVGMLQTFVLPHLYGMITFI